MVLGTWILIVATHVNSGAVISMQEFNSQQNCEYAATAARKLANDVSFIAGAHTWCVPKGR